MARRSKQLALTGYRVKGGAVHPCKDNEEARTYLREKLDGYKGNLCPQYSRAKRYGR